MRIMFDFGMESHERHFHTVLDELDSRGHEVIKTACTSKFPGYEKKVVKASDHRELITFNVFLRKDKWQDISYFTRASRDFLKYLLPDHAGSSIIKARIRNMLFHGYDGCEFDGDMQVKRLEVFSIDEKLNSTINQIFADIESLIPPSKVIVDFIKHAEVDVICVTPLVVTQYGQVEIVKAAKYLKIPVVFIANSWDNLTTKGTIHVMPDISLVWNDVQKEEAFRFHGFPLDQVIVTGAPRFDDFWARKIEVKRDDYCRAHGFDSSKPIITYLCSSNLISLDERDFVLRWVDAIRSANSSDLSSANILIRPHPKFSDGWAEQFAGIPGVAVSISKGLNNDPVLFHCLAHSRAVVGANTSAELEAAILNVPVFTVHDPDLETGQKGTIHFGYLAGSLAKIANNLSEHIEQLESEIALPLNLGRNDAFITSFLRPHGLDVRPTDVIVDYLESLINPKQLQLKARFINKLTGFFRRVLRK